MLIKPERAAVEPDRGDLSVNSKHSTDRVRSRRKLMGIDVATCRCRALRNHLNASNSNASISWLLALETGASTGIQRTKLAC